MGDAEVGQVAVGLPGRLVVVGVRLADREVGAPIGCRSIDSPMPSVGENRSVMIDFRACAGSSRQHVRRRVGHRRPEPGHRLVAPGRVDHDRVPAGRAVLPAQDGLARETLVGVQVGDPGVDAASLQASDDGAVETGARSAG